MSQSMITNASALSDAAHKVCKVALEQREETEQSRRLAPLVVDQLKTLKLFRLGLSKSLHGWDIDPVEVLKAYELLSSAEASVGWIVWNNHLACTFGRFLNESAMNEIYKNPSDSYANSTRPEGYAKVVPGGYMVSGKWTLVSGCELADWFALRCLVTSKDLPSKLGPGALLKIVYIPKDAVTIVDTWSVGGLRGTGSHDIKVQETFVPESYSISFDGHVHIDNAYSRLPIGCMNAAGCASMALGLVKSAIDELVKMSLEGITSGNNPDLRDRPRVQTAVAECLSIISAVRSNLYQSVSILWKESLARNSYTDKQLADVWAASYQAASISKSTLSEIYAVAGTSSLYTKCPIERAHRDIHAILQHGIIQPHWMNLAGMAYLGITPTEAMFRT